MSSSSIKPMARPRVDYAIQKDYSKTLNDPYKDISVNNMIQTNSKPQYEGLAPNYQVPTGILKQYRIHGQIDYSLNKKPKSTYLTEIFDKAKSPQWKRPGPTDYDSEKAYVYTTTNTKQSSNWNKEKKKSVIDVIQNREKKMKGPADYNDERKRKIPGTYNNREKTQTSAAQNEFYALEVPASNAYKPNEKASSLNKRISNANMNRDRSERDMLKPLKKDDSPSPASYKDVDRNWKRMSTHPTSNFAYSISKEKKKSFIDLEMKKKEKLPAPGKYADDMKQFAKLSRGTTIPHYKRGR